MNQALTSSEINEIMEQRTKLTTAIQDIKNYRKGQKKLYSKFYDEQRALKVLEDQYQMRNLDNWLKNMFVVDTSDVLYKRE